MVMKLSTKLILSFLVVTLLFLAIGGAFQYLNNRVKDQVVEEGEKAIRRLKLSGELEVSLYKSLINTQSFLEDRYRKSLRGEFSDTDLNTEQAWERVGMVLQNFSNSLMAAKSMLGTVNRQDAGSKRLREGNAAILNQLESRFDIYSALVDQLIPLTKQNYEDGKEFFTVTIEPYFRTNLLPLVDQLREETRENLDRETEKLNAELSEISRLLAMTTLGALILSLLLAYFLYRSIAIPLHTLAVAARHIGAGNMDERIVINSCDEIGQLGSDFIND